MYESDNANFDDMGCTWNAWHVISMSSLTSRGKSCTYEKRVKGDEKRNCVKHDQ